MMITQLKLPEKTTFSRQWSSDLAFQPQASGESIKKGCAWKAY
jgi:hypothetical protein